MRELRDIPPRLRSAVLDEARKLFLARNRFGVHAFGIGRRIRGGRQMRAMTLNVYVLRKVSNPTSPVPPLVVNDGRRVWKIIPNVIATGKRPRATLSGVSQYSGIHPGAVITTAGGAPRRGAIACVLTIGSGPSHVVTAGHLFPPGSKGMPVYAAADNSSAPRTIGVVAANFLDDAGVDGAIVRLNAFGSSLVVDVGPSLTDYLAERSVWGQSAVAYLATTGDYSRPTETTEAPIDALLSAPQRGTFWVRNAIGTDGEITNAGDSGTLLCGGPKNDLAVGVCSGVFGAHSVFEPIDGVMQLARQTIDSSLRLL